MAALSGRHILHLHDAIIQLLFSTGLTERRKEPKLLKSFKKKPWNVKIQVNIDSCPSN